MIRSNLFASTSMILAQAADVAQPESSAPATPKPVLVIDGMDSRRMFDTAEEAAAYLNQCSEKFTDFGDHAQVINGVDSEGNFDPAVYTPDMRVMVAVLANRGEKGKPSTVKAIVCTPAPKLEAILSDDAARNWLVNKVLDKELNHVAVRQLRVADDLDIAQQQMPLTLGDYISSSRESTGGIMETFNTLFKGIIAAVAAKSTPWAKRRLIKSELKKAMESKAFAAATYPELEERGDKPSLFVMAISLGINEAKKQGLDPAIFSKWLAERDSKVLSTKIEPDADEDFDLDDLAFEAEPATLETNDSADTKPAAE